GALRAARPIPAGAILALREGTTFGCRARQDIVAIGSEAYARNSLAALAQRRVHAEFVVVAVQVVKVLGDNLALEILPRTVANTIARVHRGLAVGDLRAQVGMPGFGSRAMPLSQLLTVAVGAVEATEVATLSWAKTRNKERHVWRLRQLGLLRFGGRRCHKCQRSNEKYTRLIHCGPPLQIMNPRHRPRS